MIDVPKLRQILPIAVFRPMELVPHQLRLRPVNHIAFGQLILKPMAQAIETLTFVGHNTRGAQMPVDDAGGIHVLAKTLAPAPCVNQLLRCRQ